MPGSIGYRKWFRALWLLVESRAPLATADGSVGCVVPARVEWRIHWLPQMVLCVAVPDD
jgi:hypothetical protein